MSAKLLLVISLLVLLNSCAVEQTEIVSSSPTPSDISIVITFTPRPTATLFPIKTLTPTIQPTNTVPVATLHAVATLDAIRIAFENQFPELQDYLTYCRPSYCQGVEVSPDKQVISFSNGNVIQVFRSTGERVGTYSWYEIYGQFHGYPVDYYDGSIRGILWSEDGRYLYLATQHGDGGPGPHFGYISALARVNLQNGTWKDTGISGVLSFSPNDQYIIYSTNRSEIRIRDLQHGEEKVYKTAQYYQYFGELVWSPDSAKVVFVATPNDFEVSSKFALFLIEMEGGRNLLLYEDQMPFYYPVEWVEVNKVALNKYQESGQWILDLSVDPPIITPWE